MKFLKIIAINIIVFFVLVLLLEITGQVVAWLYPSYDVLFLQPDRKLGWKQVPNLSWTWAGSYWYATDFSVPIKTNSLGFRDLPRQFTKPAGTKRVALLGDSFIEAVQVPFEKTAGSLLEQKLNASLQNTLSQQSEKWEVLNFGISNYGVGQYLLSWEEYAKKYTPDYVAIFVAYFHMKRTVRKYKRGRLSEKNKLLWVRPIFEIENNRLVHLPATDVDEVANIQKKLIKNEFGGQRMRRKTQLITLYYAKTLVKRFYRKYIKATSFFPLPKKYDVLKVNLKVIEILGQQVKSSGAHLVVVDASQYFGDPENVSNTLKQLSEENGFGYIPLYKPLLTANANGISTRWVHDGHFNETGNEILANTLYDWIAQH